MFLEKNTTKKQLFVQTTVFSPFCLTLPKWQQQKSTQENSLPGKKNRHKCVLRPLTVTYRLFFFKTYTS